MAARSLSKRLTKTSREKLLTSSYSCEYADPQIKPSARASPVSMANLPILPSLQRYRSLCLCPSLAQAIGRGLIGPGGTAAAGLRWMTRTGPPGVMPAGGRLRRTRKICLARFGMGMPGGDRRDRAPKGCPGWFVLGMLQTNRHQPEQPQYHATTPVKLTVATAHIGRLIRAALWGLRRISLPGFQDKKPASCSSTWPRPPACKAPWSCGPTRPSGCA